MPKRYEQYKSDEERLEVLNSIPCQDWIYITEWEDEAKSEEAKQIFHSTIRSMYHREEMSLD